MGVGGVLRGPKIGPTSLPFDIRVLQRSAHKIDRVLRAFYFLDKRGADGVVGGCDVYE